MNSVEKYQMTQLLQQLETKPLQMQQFISLKMIGIIADVKYCTQQQKLQQQPTCICILIHHTIFLNVKLNFVLVFFYSNAHLLITLEKKIIQCTIFN